MSKFHRILAAILASLTILPCVACAKTDNPDETKANQTTASDEADTSFFPDIAKQDYGGATFCMSGAKEDGSWYLADEYKTSSGGNGSIHVLNNTLFEMNTLVEEYLNVELQKQRQSWCTITYTATLHT